jgi:hypothetical protein
MASIADQTLSSQKSLSKRIEAVSEQMKENQRQLDRILVMVDQLNSAISNVHDTVKDDIINRS